MQQIKVVLSFLRIIAKGKNNYDRSSDRFDDPSLIALVFLDRYLMVYNPVNARGARSLKLFP